MKPRHRRALILCSVLGWYFIMPFFVGNQCVFAQVESELRYENSVHHRHGALDGIRHRVLVSTDIGGTDPDDFQSMVHLLVYGDVLEIEGLISSPYGPGRKEHILKVIDHYEKDYANLVSYSKYYPTPDALRSITKQGEKERAPYAGFRKTTEGSEWMIQCANRKDDRPLYVLVWGGLEDLAQALHDAPEIVSKLRVYWIGGPNKKWSADAFQYILHHHSDLWLIESNATYRGWFVGGDQREDYGNKGFVSEHIRGHGALGNFFNDLLGGIIKMGDTPSVTWLFTGDPTNPIAPGSWGGRFVKAWDRPQLRLNRLPTLEDRLEEFGILELDLPLDGQMPDQPYARLEVENQSLIGYFSKPHTLRFRFCPKAAKIYRFTIKSNIPNLNGQTGAIKSVPTSPAHAQRPAPTLVHWWTDDPAPGFKEGPHIGIKTVNQYRRNFLDHFATRMDRCKMRAP